MNLKKKKLVTTIVDKKRFRMKSLKAVIKRIIMIETHICIALKKHKETLRYKYTKHANI